MSSLLLARIVLVLVTKMATGSKAKLAAALFCGLHGFVAVAHEGHGGKMRGGGGVQEQGDDDDDGEMSTTIKPKPRYRLVMKNQECISSDTMFPATHSVEECFDIIRNHGGNHFIFGKGKMKGQCRREDTFHTKECLQGFKANDYDFYTIDDGVEGQRLVKPGSRCKADDDFLGNLPSLTACVGAVRAAGGRFFSYGFGRWEGQCYRENTPVESCPEGMEADMFDFYAIDEPPLGMQLIKANVQCSSGELTLGKQETLESCMEAVRAIGGRYFLYGKGARAGLCWREETTSSTCSEGFIKDQYDFYQVTSTGEGRAILVTARSQCKSKAADMGKQSSVTACMVAVKAVGGQYFNFGRIHQNTEEKADCTWVGTDSDECPEGLVRDNTVDFYKILESGETESFITLVKEDHGCRAAADALGLMPNNEACAEAVMNAGGRYFAYGKHAKDGQCYKVNSIAPDCPEGWQAGPMDFYKVDLVPKGSALMSAMMLYGGVAVGLLVFLFVAVKIKKILLPGSTPPPLLHDGEAEMTADDGQWRGSGSLMTGGGQARDLTSSNFRQF